MRTCTIKENNKVKFLRSDIVNYNFNKENGYMVTWGKTLKDNPDFSPFGPFILDLEISVNGCPNNCSFCYKGNTNDPPTNMSFDTFKKIINKLPRTINQIAFGISGIQTNPDFVKMLKYCREEKGIIPNFTLSGLDLTDEIAKEVVKYIGAVAVSAYSTNKNICYNAVKKFSDLGIKQTNIHLLASAEGKDFMYEVLKDSKTDERLSKLNAVVFLKVKPKNRAKGKFHNLKVDDYCEIVNYCLDNNISFGLDSCGAPDFEIAINRNIKLSDKRKEEIISLSESCEGSLMSSYIDVHGVYYPCSFAAGEGDWVEGLDVLNCNDFLKDVWFNEKLKEYRKNLMSDCYKSGCRKCLIFKEINPVEPV